MQDQEETADVEQPTEEAAEVVAEEATEAAAEAAAEATPEAAKKPVNEMKIVIVMRDENLMIGVQSPNCDPVYTTMKGTLPAALKKVPALVAEAKKKWETTPLNPKANLPEPTPPPTPARTPSSSPAQPKVQPSFF